MLTKLTLTNSYRIFKNSSNHQKTELSDFHKMTVSVMKTHYQKQERKIITETYDYIPLLRKHYMFHY